MRRLDNNGGVDTNRGSGYNWTEIERHDESDLKLALRWLKPFTQYEVLLQAFNEYGKGPVAKLEAFTSSDGKETKIYLIGWYWSGKL